MYVHMYVGVYTFTRSVWKPEDNVGFPQSLSILFTEAGSLAEPEAHGFK